MRGWGQNEGDSIKWCGVGVGASRVGMREGRLGWSDVGWVNDAFSLGEAEGANLGDGERELHGVYGGKVCRGREGERDKSVVADALRGQRATERGTGIDGGVRGEGRISSRGFSREWVGGGGMEAKWKRRAGVGEIGGCGGEGGLGGKETQPREVGVRRVTGGRMRGMMRGQGDGEGGGGAGGARYRGRRRGERGKDFEVVKGGIRAVGGVR
ncbi:hypothetical protein Tco_0877136 [Tanacetum coccineum]|uniref:Uncharacterized protein n=1 Tax=Tanacetum coccineum TaxID=301880 RepID=A0ABQ5BU86_9ASTR